MADNELLILRGASGSGKSTFARTLTPTHVIVSRDLIRPSVSGKPGKQVLDNAGEQRVSVLQDAQIRGALGKGLSVVVDDTNLIPAFTNRFAQIAVELNVAGRVLDFIVPLAVLLERRDPQVPEAVVRKHFNRAKNLKPIEVETPIRTPYVADTSLPPAILVDLDGTAALIPRNPTCPVHSRA